jgi:hypothetical protein
LQEEKRINEANKIKEIREKLKKDSEELRKEQEEKVARNNVRQTIYREIIVCRKDQGKF